MRIVCYYSAFTQILSELSSITIQKAVENDIMAQEQPDSTLHLPRILCLHGGGTNAKIFRTQCRRIISQLNTEFRFVFADAPFSSQAGPDVLSVYSQWGPFRRWLRWRPEQPELTATKTVKALDDCLDEAMRLDDIQGATGEWVALLGFSQGAKVCASLLYRQQERERPQKQQPSSYPKFRFGVLLAGRAPLISLETNHNEDQSAEPSPPLPDAAQMTDFAYNDSMLMFFKGHFLRIPTIHVHGLRDQGLELHRKLYEDYCEPGSRILVQWDGDHRVPLKRNDVDMVVFEIRELAKQTGVN